MRVTRYDVRTTISCSEHEFEILVAAVALLEAKEPSTVLNSTGLRRSWARRTSGGSFLRVDKDKRTDEYL